MAAPLAHGGPMRYGVWLFGRGRRLMVRGNVAVAALSACASPAPAGVGPSPTRADTAQAWSPEGQLDAEATASVTEAATWAGSADAAPATADTGDATATAAQDADAAPQTGDATPTIADATPPDTTPPDTTLPDTAAPTADCLGDSADAAAAADSAKIKWLPADNCALAADCSPVTGKQAYCLANVCAYLTSWCDPGLTTSLQCNDGHPETVDVCGPADPGQSPTGYVCKHVCAQDSDCDFGVGGGWGCTKEFCAYLGDCKVTVTKKIAGCCDSAADCDDGDPCTADSCQYAKLTCLHVPNCCDGAP